jgi:magnesium transporter
VNKHHRHRRHKPLFHRRAGHLAAPGTLKVDPQAPKPLVRLMAYDATGQCVERELRTAAELDGVREIVDRHAVTWVNVEGLGDADVVARLGKVFGLHPLALEDVVNDHQRSKVEPYGDHLFIVARMLEAGESLENDQLAMFLGAKFLVTFQHIVGDCFDPVRERVRGRRGLICSSGPDYLAYALLDSVVDSYFPVLEAIGDEIESLEAAIIANEAGSLISQIHDVKGKLRMLRRAIWPLREALHVLVRDPIPVIRDDTRVYLRDCADHTFQIIDLVETYRELASDLLDLYHSSLSNRMNEVMQVLTVIATIFIPLTFIVGIYGMNFDPDSSPWNMPELRWYWGYPAIWGAMLAIAGGMLWFFQRKGWLPGFRTRRRRPAKAAGNGGD